MRFILDPEEYIQRRMVDDREERKDVDDQQEHRRGDVDR